MAPNKTKIRCFSYQRKEKIIRESTELCWERRKMDSHKGKEANPLDREGKHFSSRRIREWEEICLKKKMMVPSHKQENRKARKSFQHFRPWKHLSRWRAGNLWPKESQIIKCSMGSQMQGLRLCCFWQLHFSYFIFAFALVMPVLFTI